jgi:hypothetical protein
MGMGSAAWRVPRAARRAPLGPPSLPRAPHHAPQVPYGLGGLCVLMSFSICALTHAAVSLCRPMALARAALGTCARWSGQPRERR